MSEMEVPEGWESKKILEITESYAGGTPSTGKNEFWDDGKIPWFRSGKLKDNILDSSDNFITEKGLKNSSAKLYPPESTLVAITGATTGKTAFLKIEACGTQNVFGILPCEEVLPKYLWYYMRYYYKQLVSKSIGGAQGHVNGTIIKNTIIYFPKDKKIQKKIVKKLDDILEKLEDNQKQIQKLTVKNYQYLSLLSDKIIGNIFAKKMQLENPPKNWKVHFTAEKKVWVVYDVATVPILTEDETVFVDVQYIILTESFAKKGETIARAESWGIPLKKFFSKNKHLSL